MNKQAIANTLKSLQKTMRKHSPAILTGIGIAGMAAAAVMAVRATPKALRMVDDREIEDEKRLTTSEIVKTTWIFRPPLPAYAPPPASLGPAPSAHGGTRPWSRPIPFPRLL